MIDHHCHILPGIDDGPDSLEGSLEIASTLSRFGFTTVHCTPHFIRGAYDNEADDIRQRAERLQEMLQMHSIPLKLLPAAEYIFDEYLADQLKSPLTIAGRYVLVEASPHTPYEVVYKLAKSVLARGLVPLIAHPERSRFTGAGHRRDNPEESIFSPLTRLFARGNAAESAKIPPAIQSLLDAGCRFQGNLGSLAGIYGESVRKRAVSLASLGVYSCLGSDAHRPHGLDEMLREGISTLRETVGPETASLLLSGSSLL